MLLALFNGPMATWSFVDFLVMIVIVAGCIAVAWIALKAMGIQLPQWLIQIIIVVIVVVVAVFAIRLIASM